jgi:hypothetical protein
MAFQSVQMPREFINHPVMKQVTDGLTEYAMP